MNHTLRFMKQRLAVLALAAVLLSSAFAADARKPNILLIYSDDHGWADLGAQGVDKDIRTPNLDQLARDGVQFACGRAHGAASADIQSTAHRTTVVHSPNHHQTTRPFLERRARQLCISQLLVLVGHVVVAESV